MYANGLLLLLLIAFRRWSKHRYAGHFRHAQISAQSKTYSIFNSKLQQQPMPKSSWQQHTWNWERERHRAVKELERDGKWVHKKENWNLYAVSVHFVRSFIRWFCSVVFLFIIEFLAAKCVRIQTYFDTLWMCDHIVCQPTHRHTIFNAPFQGAWSAI